MKILFIQPSGTTLRGLPGPPYSILYVAAIAEKKGHTVKILDRTIENNTKKVICDFQPDLVGITSLTGHMIIDALRVCEFIKHQFPEVPIIWGGIHASIFPQQTLEHPLIDFIVIGEGEITFEEFLNAYEGDKDYSKILGLGYKKGGNIFINEKRPFLKTLDDLPLTPWHLIDYKKYLKYETLFITSRGCPHRCSFCYNEEYYFRTWRAMSSERVKKEFEHVQKFHPIRRYRFDDDNFTVNKKRLYQILDYIPKNASLYMDTRIDYVDEEFCRRLAEFYDPYLFIGIESGDEEMLKHHQKDITIEQIRKNYRLLKKYKINTTASFVIGSPGETKEQIKKTMDLANELKPTRYTFCVFTPYPGSKYYKEIASKNSLALPKNLEEWGKFSTCEAALLNYCLVSSKYLNRIYRKYYYKSILSFITHFRWGWLGIGLINAKNVYQKKIIRRINGDI